MNTANSKRVEKKIKKKILTIQNNTNQKYSLWFGISILFCYFLIFYLFIFRERGREVEREEEKHQCVIASSILPNGDLAHNKVMCPDQEIEPAGN